MPPFIYIRLFNYKSIDKEGRTSILHSDLEEYINSDRYDAYFFSEPYQGQKWIEVYLKYASLVFFEIGRPIFFNGISSEVKEAILSQQISQNDNIKLAATEVAGDTASAATLITFAPAGVEYAFGVKLLTDAIAQFMDIDGESVNEFLNAHNFNAAGRGSLWRHDLQTGVGSITQYRDYFGLPKSYDNAVRVDKDGKRTTDHIEVKDLDNNFIEINENNLLNLNSIKYLSLRNTNITSCNFFSNSKNIKFLDISNCSIEDYKDLNKLKELLPQGVKIHFGDLTYIAQTLHIFQDTYSENIAKNIIDEATYY